VVLLVDVDLKRKLSFFIKLLEERFLVRPFRLPLLDTERGDEELSEACELADCSLKVDNLF